MSAASLLEECEAAISACLQSQSYSVADRMQQRARLTELRQLRAELLREVQESSAGGMASLGQIDQPY